MGRQWKQWETLFWGSKITADGDCSHEIKRHLLLGRKAMTNLDRIFKSRAITLPTKVHLVNAMVFPVVMYGCESWTVKKAERRGIDAFELWCWRRLLRVSWTSRRSNQSILKEISPETPLLWLPDAKNWLTEKTLVLGTTEGGRRRGWQRMRWLDVITNLMDMSLSKLHELVKAGKPGVLQSMGFERVGHDCLSKWTEQNWSTILSFFSFLLTYLLVLFSWLYSPPCFSFVFRFVL